MSGLDIQFKDGKTILGVKVVPGSSRTAAAGKWNGMLKVKVAAPPERGKANEALTEFLAEALGIRAKDVLVISGQTNPVKRVEISASVEPGVIERLASESRRG